MARSQPSVRIETTPVRPSVSSRPTICTGTPRSRSALSPSRNCPVRTLSCSATASMPVASSQRSPARSPAMPGRFRVPASNRSGMKSGISSRWLTLPVPPAISGSISLPIPSPRIKPPMPWGPRRPLCPVKARASMCSSPIWMGRMPAVWAVSTIKRSPWARQNSPASRRGRTVPQTLLAWVMTSALVLGLRQAVRAASGREPSVRHPARENSTPCWASWVSGRITALCSMEVVITWSPGFKNPFKMMFKLSVTFFVNTTFLQSPPPKNRHSRSLASKTKSSAP